MSKKSSTKTKKPSATNSPRMSKGAARAEGAAKTERLRKAAIAEIAERLADGKEDHEVPTAKEVANATHAATTSTTKAKRGNAEKAAKEKGAKDAKATPTREAKPKRASGLDLAAKVLASAKEPLNSKSIAERVLAAGWSTSGKTPHATLYAAMIREIAAKGTDARFRKTDRGLFTAINGKGA